MSDTKHHPPFQGRMVVKDKEGNGHNMKKYIFVTGGVVSGLGKGITAASLGRLLKARGL